MYNTLLSLSRNIFFYKNLRLPDTFETRINLILFHFSIMIIIFKKKGKIFNQQAYDNLFLSVENNLRELGFGDVSVNKKMKDLNKILYDILIKIEIVEKNTNDFKMSSKVILKYFSDLKDKNDDNYLKFETYFLNFYKYCFELSLKNMIKDALKFKY